MQNERTRADPLLSSAAEWLTRFEQCEVKYLALDPYEDRRLIQLLQSRPEWTLDCRDHEGVLFVRSDVHQAQGTPVPSRSSRA